MKTWHIVALAGLAVVYYLVNRGSVGTVQAVAVPNVAPTTGPTTEARSGKGHF